MIKSGISLSYPNSIGWLLRELLVQLFTDALFGEFAPADAGLDVIIDDKTTGGAGHLDIGGEKLDIGSAGGAPFHLQCGRAGEVGSTGTVFHSHYIHSRCDRFLSGHNRTHIIYNPNQAFH